MKRVQLFEFEDFDWFPAWMRASMTNLIAVLHRMMGTREVLVSLLEKVASKYDFDRIVDMGSGSGGIMPEVLAKMNEAGDRKRNLLLTDLHPNLEFIGHIRSQGMAGVDYRARPLDATNLKEAPEGLKTMVNSFHHMPPDRARKILLSAQENHEPILIYEIGENKMPLLLWWILLPISLTILILMTLIMTPFSKPLSVRQLVFTYLIPVIPIFYAWDGQASVPRMYTYADIEELLVGKKSDKYHWEMGPAKKEGGKQVGYYILGLPQ
ncbi:MAG: hypothetical protein EP338_02795 [Bacteroidetes bacterium]|nr:MAG: hypothetical protein EP338_02795 [Bacteroidota bacterium]